MWISELDKLCHAHTVRCTGIKGYPLSNSYRSQINTVGLFIPPDYLVKKRYENVHWFSHCSSINLGTNEKEWLILLRKHFKRQTSCLQFINFEVSQRATHLLINVMRLLSFGTVNYTGQIEVISNCQFLCHTFSHTANTTQLGSFWRETG